MEISVLIEPGRSTGFRATAPSHPELAVEAATEAAAIQQLRDQLCERLKLVKMIKVNVPTMYDKPWIAAAGCQVQDRPEETAPHPWEIAFGAFRDHPDFPDVMENMRAYREQRDQEAELP